MDRKKKNRNNKTYTGTFLANARGFGFVSVPGMDEDCFVPRNKTNNAFHRDTVEIIIKDGYRGKGKSREAEVVRVLSHGITEVVGVINRSRGFGFVTPDDDKIGSDIFIPGQSLDAMAEKDREVKSGDKVVVKMTFYGNSAAGKRPEGEVIEILGSSDEPGVDMVSIIRTYGLPESFSKEVLKEADKAAGAGKTNASRRKKSRFKGLFKRRSSKEDDKVRFDIDADLSDRTDLRNVFTITIDGEDSKDLDDAISIEKVNDGYRLGVHIADVSHYVKEGSALDAEALNRGNSVYLADRVIPMLPQVLSNGICSLNENEDRLTLSCIMEYNEYGKLIDYKIVKSVIRSDHRMTYSRVAEILDKIRGAISPDTGKDARAGSTGFFKRFPFIGRDEKDTGDDKDLVNMLSLAAELSEILRRNRQARGGIEFTSSECEFKFDKSGKVIEVRPHERNDATDLIEDFMLAANETVATHFYWLGIPFVYRVHGKPDKEKIDDLQAFVKKFGYYLKVSREGIHPRELQALLDKSRGTKAEYVIHTLALRSMQQARYSSICDQHFGLALEHYTHFTSPIRRYPDLQIHRIIKEYLNGDLNEERMAHYAEILDQVCAHSCETERRAVDAERDTDKRKKCEYMKAHIGETFSGIISGMASHGMYVTLPNTVEGMINVMKIPDDKFFFDEKEYVMRGKRSGITYSLGDEIEVVVDGVDENANTIDFIM